MNWVRKNTASWGDIDKRYCWGTDTAGPLWEGNRWSKGWNEQTICKCRNLWSRTASRIFVVTENDMEIELVSLIVVDVDVDLWLDVVIGGHKGNPDRSEEHALGNFWPV